MNEDTASPATTAPHVPGWLRTPASYGWRLLVLVAVAAIVFFLFRQLKILLIGIILGYLESVALWPLVRWMRAHRVNKVAAALIATAVAVAILVLFFVLMIRAFVGQAAELASEAASG